MFKEGIVALFVLAAVMLLAVFLKIPNEPIANPTDTSYIPRPEWYFLFLFQALKYFSGSTEVLGTFLLPGIFILALILLPFYDRKAEKRWTKRTRSGRWRATASIASTPLRAVTMRASFTSDM